MAFNDAALLTATGNDAGYDQVFAHSARPGSARAGDLLIAISSSGNSPNVVRALEAAAGLGVAAVTLTAKQPDNRARALGDLNFYVPLDRYGWAESAHQVILHYWFDQYLDRSPDPGRFERDRREGTHHRRLRLRRHEADAGHARANAARRRRSSTRCGSATAWRRTRA